MDLLRNAINTMQRYDSSPALIMALESVSYKLPVHKSTPAPAPRVRVFRKNEAQYTGQDHIRTVERHFQLTQLIDDGGRITHFKSYLDESWKKFIEQIEDTYRAAQGVDPSWEYVRNYFLDLTMDDVLNRQKLRDWVAIKMNTKESVAQYYLRFSKCGAECNNHFDEVAWRSPTNSIFDKFVLSMSQEIQDTLDTWYTRDEWIKFTPKACVTLMNQKITSMSKTHFHGRYSGEIAGMKRKRNDDDDAVNVADDPANLSSWKKKHGANFNVSKLTKEQRDARYRAGECFNCGSKKHLHINCPNEKDGGSNPTSRGSGNHQQKNKGKSHNKQRGRGGDQANVITSKQAKKAEEKQFTKLEKRLKKSLMASMIDDLNNGEVVQQITDGTVSGNVPGAAVQPSATPSTSTGNQRRRVQFRLQPAE
jgi:hypothetical protein